MEVCLKTSSNANPADIKALVEGYVTGLWLAFLHSMNIMTAVPLVQDTDQTPCVMSAGAWAQSV